ncbi:formylglycine-generating enzyme family protein [Streptomyces sp. NPDC060205]|uniref:formylglycine-generating enzyme family protein n=1 Tax=Streptomyces sp. NPDC060205 TaxID=3347072 RepID=UPI0036579A4B
MTPAESTTHAAPSRRPHSYGPTTPHHESRFRRLGLPHRHGGRRALRTVLLSATAVVVLAACQTGPEGSGASDRVPDPAATRTPTGAPQMALVPAGAYLLGAADGPADERPVHTVRLDAFRLDRYPVTNADLARWANGKKEQLRNATGGQELPADPRMPREPDAVRDKDDRDLFVPADADGNSHLLRANGRFDVEKSYADHPATEVTWWGAYSYCRDRGARLPTEAEWEAAARGPEGRTYAWGEQEPNAERARYGAATGGTAPVNAHPEGATPLGIHDLAGNTYEWTSTLYRPYPYDGSDGREEVTYSAEERVTRGGAHDDEADALRGTYRSGYSREPQGGHHHIGFRCAADPRP